MFDCCNGDDVLTDDLNTQLGTQAIKGDDLVVLKDLPLPQYLDMEIKTQKGMNLQVILELIKFKFEDWDLGPLKEFVKVLDKDQKKPPKGEMTTLRRILDRRVKNADQLKRFHSNPIKHLELENGGRYLGQLDKKNEKEMEGVGILLDQNSNLFISCFQRNLPDLFGICLYQNLDYYIGDFINGQKLFGEMFFSENEKLYIGQFKLGLPHGGGQIYFKDGRNYKGSLENGKPHGDGVFAWPNGNIYTGGFRDGKQEGSAQLFVKEKNQTFYTHWKNGELQN
jgi:hypothetical protein